MGELEIRMNKKALHSSDILTLFSIGILQLETMPNQNKIIPLLPLNATVRRGWEQLSYLYFYEGEIPPRTLPELIQLLNTPTNQWPVIGIVLSEQDFSLPLIQKGMPSSLCIRLASPFMNVYNLQQELEDHVFRQIHERCYELGNPDLYTSVRVFINRNVILEDVYESIAANPTWPDSIRGLLSQCYQRIPVKCVRKRCTGRICSVMPSLWLAAGMEPAT
jgi:hypothetical protein